MRGRRTVSGGRGRVRAVLYMGALVASRHNPVIRSFYQRLRGGGEDQETGADRLHAQAADHLNSMVKHGQRWNPHVISS